MSEENGTQIAPPESAAAGTTATAPAKPREQTKPSKKNAPKNLPPFHVVLLNDDDHSYEYVIKMLKSIFGHSEQKGFKMAEEVDRHGRAIVFTTHKELAELKRDQIHGHGIDDTVATCQGSMTATIEPADV